MNASSIIIPVVNQTLLSTGDENKMVETKKAEPKKMNATKPAGKPVAKSVPQSKK